MFGCGVGVFNKPEKKKGKVGTNRKNEVLIDVISLSMIHCGEIYLFFHFPIYLFLFRGYKMEEG